MLEANKILVAKVPNGDTDELQPLDLSVNKSYKSIVREKCNFWYLSEVKTTTTTQLSTGIQAREEKLDMRMQVVWKLIAQLVGFFDYMQNRKEVVVNGFNEAGIRGALDV